MLIQSNFNQKSFIYFIYLLFSQQNWSRILMLFGYFRLFFVCWSHCILLHLMFISTFFCCCIEKAQNNSFYCSVCHIFYQNQYDWVCCIEIEHLPADHFIFICDISEFAMRRELFAILTHNNNIQAHRIVVIEHFYEQKIDSRSMLKSTWDSNVY